MLSLNQNPSIIGYQDESKEFDHWQYSDFYNCCFIDLKYYIYSFVNSLFVHQLKLYFHFKFFILINFIKIFSNYLKHLK
jgi:hypothetical protein